MIVTPEEDFKSFVKNPTQWLLKSRTLYRASMRLFEGFREALNELGALDGALLDEAAEVMADQQMFEPAAMLAGYCLEVTIKAAIVAKFPDRVEPGMKGRDWMGRQGVSGHDLVALAQVAEVRSADEEFLAMLTKFLVWKGRYPSSLSGTAMYGSQTELENLPGTHWLGFIEQFEGAYFTIRDQVEAIIRESEHKRD